MPTPEDDDQVFIVRLRLERFDEVERLPVLRGVAEQVHSDTRRNTVNPEELKQYVDKELCSKE